MTKFQQSRQKAPGKSHSSPNDLSKASSRDKKSTMGDSGRKEILEKRPDSLTESKNDTHLEVQLTEEQKMMTSMNLPFEFSSSKGKKHKDKSSTLSGIYRKSSRLKYNQFMNLKKKGDHPKSQKESEKRSFSRQSGSDQRGTSKGMKDKSKLQRK